ncbi:MAG: hypothetical protein JO036_22085 [Candidatus Eremiobacteraeota bacterium]|nr:hypothetical protein [Candidatus Eremiobacteraeota bacterium]
MERSVPLRREEIRAGLLAGIAGAITIEVFYFLTFLPGGDAVKMLVGSFAFVSSVLVGPSTRVTPAVLVFGIVLNFCVSVGWALGYVYLARTRPQLIAHPWLSGAAFGLVVYLFSQIVLLAAGANHMLSSPEDLTIQVIAHIVFYGIPVALVASRLLRASTGSG